MSVTLTQSLGGRIAGGMTNLTAVSTLGTAGTTVYFYWYLDGIYAGMTTGSNTGSGAVSSKAFAGLSGGQARIDVLDSTSAALDYLANAPQVFPPRRLVVWLRSLDASIDRYQVQQQKNGGAWSVIGTVADDAGVWQYQLLTPRLDDLASYAWRVVPIDVAGNAGTPLALAAEEVVRQPDAPGFGITFNHNATTVTFTAA